MAKRVELTFPDGLYDRMEEARAGMSRAAWIKQLVEAETAEIVTYVPPPQGSGAPVRPCTSCGALSGHQRNCPKA